MRTLSRYLSLIFVSFAILFTGCITFRSDITGLYKPETSSGQSLPRVKVFFRFVHTEFERGYDVVPKTIAPFNDFKLIFAEAIKEIKNISSYATFTDYAFDVEDPKRRNLRDSLAAANDYTIYVKIQNENSFAAHFLAHMFLYSSAGLIPVKLNTDYTIAADVITAEGKVIKTYSRTATLSSWNHSLLVFFYPFYPAEGVKEEIYFNSMKDIFRQIETEKILSKGN